MLDKKTTRREFLELSVKGAAAAVTGIAALDELLPNKVEAAPTAQAGANVKNADGIISLPKGGGAIKGIGEKFAPDLFTGTGNFTVPLEIPKGRNGFQPQLKLVYSTGSGNSPFGLGWSLSVPGVTRKTSKGVPLYDDDKDVFILSGLEDLVPVSSAGATTTYRPRTESGFARITHHRENQSGNDYWEVRSRDGTVSVYGTPKPTAVPSGWSDPAVVSDPNNATHRLTWKLTETRDPFGNRVLFEYVRDATRVDGSHRWDQSYLAAVRYADYGDPDDPDFLVEVRLQYSPRPDPFSEYRPGFEVRTVSRCSRIEVWTNPGTPTRVRTYHFTYLDEIDDASLRLPINGVSLLTEITVEGHDDAQSRYERLPPLRLAYGEFEPWNRSFNTVKSPDLPPNPVTGERYEMLDLFGNGLPDILEVGDQVRFWRNLGQCRFDLAKSMKYAPAGVRLGDVGVQLLDADGDGRADLMVANGGPLGYYPLTFHGEFDSRSFRPYRRNGAPTFDLRDPEVKLLDLDGDGVTDALRSGTSFECYFNHPQNGWYDTRRVARRQLESFPDVNFSDPRVKWGDMTGDGLTDIVLIHNGRVDYWPSLGRGNFSPRVTMTSAPHLPAGYDPRRILLGDVDGDGAADLVYVDDRKVMLWINRGGNGWSDPIEISGTPRVTNADAVRLSDLLGSGVPGVLWTQEHGVLTDDSMFFLDFTGGHKPYLLERIDNGLGAITNVSYAPSTLFYLKDQQDSPKWLTPLPFPVHVVARLESIDQLSGGKLTTEYRYHHGYWDGGEREFRGYGRVDLLDSEVFEQYHASGLDVDSRAFRPVEARQFSPPTETRTWFHLGPVGEEFGDWKELDYSTEFWQGDLQAFPEMPEIALDSLPRRARRDAIRALRGRMLRSELYARDGSTHSNRPYTVTEQLHSFKTVVPPAADGAKPGVYFPYQNAERTTQWGRGDDPMTQLAFTGDYDAYGQPQLQLSIAVPRGRDYLTSPAASAEPFLATHTVTAYARGDDTSHYIVDRVAHRTTYEIPDDGRTSVADPRPSAVELWRRIERWKLGQAGSIRQQVIAQTLHHYDGNEFEGLPLEQLGTHGALKRVEQLVLTETLLHDGYRSGLSVSTPPEEPSYLDRSGAGPAWRSDYPPEFRAHVSRFVQPPPRGTAVLGGYIFYVSDAVRQRGFYAATTQRAHNSRGLIMAERDPFGNETSVEYGGYELLPIAVTDPAKLVNTASYDYRVFQATLATDPSGNETEYRYTPLGLLESIATLGRRGQNEGDTASMPSIRFEYNFGPLGSSGQPAYVHTTRRRNYVTDPDDHGELVESREYFDGFGRVLQTRAQAEDVLFGGRDFGDDILPIDQSQNTNAVGRYQDGGERPNVVVSGWQAFDNKGRVIEKFEPFFSIGWEYSEPEVAQRGQKVTFHHDPLGRLMRTINADGSELLTIFGSPRNLTNPFDYEPSPWESYYYDTNDNAGRASAPDPRAATYSTHWNTPSSMVIDAMGRTVEQIERNGANPETDRYTTRQQRDIRGNTLKIWDQSGRLAFQHVYDLLDRRIRTEHLDAGVERMVLDAAGNLIEKRDGKSAVILRVRDKLQRPTFLWASDKGTEAVTLREFVLYGDSAEAGLSSAEAKKKNLLGKPYKSYDEAGLLHLEEYDLKGNVVEKSRQVVSDTRILSTFNGAAGANWQVNTFRVDWSPPTGTSLEAHAMTMLDAVATYRISQRFNALSRVKWIDYPIDVGGGRKRLLFDYNRSGSLEQMRMDDGTIFIERIAYNARGQRTLVAYGDRDASKPGPRVMCRYAYDPKTFRLVRMRTEHFNSPAALTFVPAGSTLQDVGYEYDLAGNLLAMHDRTPSSGVPGQPDEDRLDRMFTYDPLYRLVSATGRECDLALPDPWDPAPRCQDITRTRRYTREYDYDPSGNLTRLKHHLTGGMGATVPARHFDLVSGTNRLATMQVGAILLQYQYDSSGNLTSENAERHLEWDHSDRLRAFRVQPAGAEPSKFTHYLYDRSGQRVMKLVRKQGGAIEATIYVDGIFEHNRVVSSQSSHEHNTLNVLDNENRIAMIRIGEDPDDATPAVQFHLGDHLGSSVVVIDQSGGWVNREEYTPYGEDSFGSYSRKRYRFNGKERDPESGLYYFGARYYAPWLARWTSPDPAREVDGLNLYYYSRNNPLRFRDTTGTQAEPLPEEVVQQACGVSTPSQGVSATSAEPPGELKLSTETLDPVSQPRDTPYSVATQASAPQTGTHTMPAARWQGEQQTLKADASDSAFRYWGFPGIPEDCGEYTTRAVNAAGYEVGGSLSGRAILPRGHGEEVNGRAVLPIAENKQILNTIDNELYNGSVIAVAADYKPGGRDKGDGLSEHWFYITGRDFEPDGTVYYTGLDNASGEDDPKVRLYVDSETFSLVKPGAPNVVGYTIDQEYRIVNVTPLQRVR